MVSNMNYDIRLKSNTKGFEFKIKVDDSVSDWFRSVIKNEHYFYNPALLHLQSIDQGKEWKAKIEYPVNIKCDFLSNKVLIKDKYSKEFESLQNDYLQLLYVPKTNLFRLVNLGDTSYEFDFIYIDDLQRNF